MSFLRAFLGTTLLITFGCSDSDKKSKQELHSAPIFIDSMQGSFVSASYQVDYSKAEQIGGWLLLNSDELQLFNNPTCQDIDKGSASATDDMTGKIRVHLNIEGTRFELYNQIDFYRGSKLIGRKCKNGLRKGEVSNRSDRQIELIWDGIEGQRFVTHLIEKRSEYYYISEIYSEAYD